MTTGILNFHFSRPSTGRFGRLVKAFAVPALAMAGIVWSYNAVAAPPPPKPPQTAMVTVTPGVSDGGINAVCNSGNVCLYEISVFDGDSVSDSIPVEFCSMDHVGELWESYDIGVGDPSGGLKSTVSYDPASGVFTFANSDPKCETLKININTGALILANPSITQTFTANINGIKATNLVPDKGDGKPDVTEKGPAGDKGTINIHIRIDVHPLQGDNIACYMTDSGGNFLLDAFGNPVDESSSDDGIFAVVVNKKGYQVATNPGQFYFNFVFWNSSAFPKTVKVDMTDPEPVGVVANGNNAVHSALFGDVFDPSFQASFNCANNGTVCYSTPWGKVGMTGDITVPPETTLLVTYHLEWKYLKQPWSEGCIGVAPNVDCPISVTGVLYEKLGEEYFSVGDPCTAGAHGYGKK